MSDLHELNQDISKCLNIVFFMFILVFNIGFLVRLLMRRKQQASVQKFAILISITSLDIFLAVFSLPAFTYESFSPPQREGCGIGILVFVAGVSARFYTPCVYALGLMMLSMEIFLRHRLQSGTRMLKVMASVFAASAPHVLSLLVVLIITVAGLDYEKCIYYKIKFFIAIVFLTNIIPTFLAVVVVALLTCIPPLKPTQPSSAPAGGYNPGSAAYPGSTHDRPPSFLGAGDAPLQNPHMTGDHPSDLLPLPPPPPPSHTESVKGTWDSDFAAHNEPNFMYDSSSAMKDPQWSTQPQAPGSWPPPNVSEPGCHQGQASARLMYNPSSSPDTAKDNQSAAGVRTEKRAVLIVSLVNFICVMPMGVWSVVQAYGYLIEIPFFTYFLMHVICFWTLILRSVLTPILWRFLS